MHCAQPRPTGQREPPLIPVVALICGVTGGTHAQVPPSADHAPARGVIHAWLRARVCAW